MLGRKSCLWWLPRDFAGGWGGDYFNGSDQFS